MRKLPFILLLLTFISVVFVRCSNNTVNDRIGDAYVAYGEKDMEFAQEQVRQILEQDSLEQFSCKDLCRLSILLMKLSEQGYEENIAPAVTCYYRCFEANSDSATIYFSQLPMEDEPYVTILSSLSMSLDPEKEFRMEEFELNEDSILLMLNNNADA